jgi:hypothetical protein
MVERLPPSEPKPLIKLITGPLKLLRLLPASLISLLSQHPRRLNEKPKAKAFHKNLFHRSTKRGQIQSDQRDYWG